MLCIFYHSKKYIGHVIKKEHTTTYNFMYIGSNMWLYTSMLFSYIIYVYLSSLP